jgi:hypothetical protein
MVNERCAETVLRCIRVVTNFLNNVPTRNVAQANVVTLFYRGASISPLNDSAPPLVPLAPRPHEIEQTAGRRYGPFC